MRQAGMQRIVNFGGGPSLLPDEVLHQVARDLLDWRGTGMGILEVSHRGAEFRETLHEAEADLRALLSVPPDYRILFMQGGGRAQDAIVPMNLMRGRKSAAYVQTGVWSCTSRLEATRYCDARVAASSGDRNFTYVPPLEQWSVPDDAAYVHVCTNETVGGVEYPWTPQLDRIGCGHVPLVADMSSHLLSRPVDVSRFGLIYAGAQKNIGPAGLTLVIVREDLIGNALSSTPSVFDYRRVADQGSLFNTPPTLAIHVAALVFKWLLRRGGLLAIERENMAKAKLLYDAIDASTLYRNGVTPTDRSRMNVTFRLTEPVLDQAFLEGANARGLAQLKGHAAVGGMRASLYNAMPIEGVRALVDYMVDFERTRA
jgi:phosphoserine aminotransferase